MSENHKAYLLVGQRGSGKSEYSKKLLANQPELIVFNRDEIIRRLCGSESPEPYSGGIEFGIDVMHRLLRRRLSTTKTELKIVLDCWTGTSSERKALIHKLRSYGAGKVVALYFVTPLSIVNEWFWKKPGIARASARSARQQGDLVFFCKDAPANDYKLFHKWAQDIDRDGFDQVIRINPLESPVVLD